MTNPQQRFPRRHGFTLVELLVVIAVIAILAAILIPVLTRAREKANQTKCLSNLRQLAIAMNDYADSNRGRFPGYQEQSVDGLVWENGRSDDGIWASRIDGFLGGAKALWECPSAADVGQSFREELQSAESGVPYGINNSLSQRRSDGTVIGVPASAPRAPRNTVLLIENDGFDAGGLLGGEPDPARRHGEGARWFNVTYCDSRTEPAEEINYPEEWDLK